MTTIPRTLFVYKRAGFDTARIRATQIAGELGCDTIWIREFTAEIGEKYDVVIYVKRTPDNRRIMDTLDRRGVKQVFDVLDNYSNFRINRAAPFIDAMIGANLTHAVYLQAHFGVPTIEIPHHHCNFDELRVPFRDPPTLGFISNPPTWPVNKKLAEKIGLPIVSNIARKGEKAFVELIDTYMAVDIGFAYRMDEDKLRFNCANKLTNFMSFGIPSVLTPETGYLEFGRHGETVLYAHTKQDFTDLLAWLASDPDLRRRMSDACYETAKPLHISRIAERYREFLRNV